MRNGRQVRGKAWVKARNAQLWREGQLGDRSLAETFLIEFGVCTQQGSTDWQSQPLQSALKRRKFSLPKALHILGLLS